MTVVTEAMERDVEAESNNAKRLRMWSSLIEIRLGSPLGVLRKDKCFEDARVRLVDCQLGDMFADESQRMMGIPPDEFHEVTVRRRSIVFPDNW